jgi:hypothetical protein
MSGKQIRLFRVDGTPGGLTTSEITNWTGHVLTGPRSDIGALLQRDEARRTGVYLLLGDDEEALGDTRCYIGEADVVAERLRSHLRDKEFWDRIVVITSKDANLTKSHGRYLESRLIQLATKAGRATLENGTAPPTPQLPEADISDMDESSPSSRSCCRCSVSTSSAFGPWSSKRSVPRRRPSHRSSCCRNRVPASTPEHSRSTVSSRSWRARLLSPSGVGSVAPRVRRSRTPRTGRTTRSSSPRV